MQYLLQLRTASYALQPDTEENIIVGSSNPNVSNVKSNVSNVKRQNRIKIR